MTMHTEQEARETLKSCPFCDCEAVMRRTVREYGAGADGPAGEYDEWFAIHCDGCGINVGEEYREEAVSAWNRRAGQP